jgi:hypothetical protein
MSRIRRRTTTLSRSNSRSPYLIVETRVGLLASTQNHDQEDSGTLADIGPYPLSIALVEHLYAVKSMKGKSLT